MKASLALLGAATILFGAGCASSSHSAAPVSGAGKKASSPFLPTPPIGGPRRLVLFGHVKSLEAKGPGYEVRVDPAEYLSGATANRAAAEDKVIPAGDVVPNDHYIREAGHRLLTYEVSANAHVTVVTNAGTRGIFATRIPVSELAAIVKGKNPRHRALFEPRNPFWIVVANDRALSFDQQYSP
jgi:hypothetical protein